MGCAEWRLSEDGGLGPRSYIPSRRESKVLEKYLTNSQTSGKTLGVVEKSKSQSDVDRQRPVPASFDEGELAPCFGRPTRSPYHGSEL